MVLEALLGSRFADRIRQSQHLHPQHRSTSVRRAMGLVSACTKEISRSGHTLACVHIGTAIATMRRYNRIRTPYFQEMTPQYWRHHAQSLQQTAGHAQKTNL